MPEKSTDQMPNSPRPFSLAGIAARFGFSRMHQGTTESAATPRVIDEAIIPRFGFPLETFCIALKDHWKSIPGAEATYHERTERGITMRELNSISAPGFNIEYSRGDDRSSRGVTRVQVGDRELWLMRVHEGYNKLTYTEAGQRYEGVWTGESVGGHGAPQRLRKEFSGFGPKEYLEKTPAELAAEVNALLVQTIAAHKQELPPSEPQG